MSPTDTVGSKSSNQQQTLTSQQVVDLTRQYNYGTWRFQKNWNPMHIADAEGCYIIDGAGKRYLDFSSQLMCSNLGPKNQAVIDAIARQAQELCYAMPGYATTARAELSQLLTEVLPKGLNKFFFTTSGTEANEAAFKIARMYTGKTKIIARYRSYHGSTAGSIAATGDPRRWAMEPGGKGPGVLFAPEVHCYKCPIRHTYPGCGIACADYIEHMIRNESDVAAVLVEPIVGTNGVIVPPEEYMPKLRRICDEYGVLLIADEVMTGWGRTGEWFAMNYWGVVPDILVTAKGITSAYVPLGLCATSEKIAEFFEDHYFAHGHTYEAHPLTLAPAVATIREIQRPTSKPSSPNSRASIPALEMFGAKGSSGRSTSSKTARQKSHSTRTQIRSQANPCWSTRSQRRCSAKALPSRHGSRTSLSRLPSSSPKRRSTAELPLLTSISLWPMPPLSTEAMESPSFVASNKLTT
jgi:taurine--2-oxoglutarate transaminase